MAAHLAVLHRDFAEPGFVVLAYVVVLGLEHPVAGRVDETFESAFFDYCVAVVETLGGFEAGRDDPVLALVLVAEEFAFLVLDRFEVLCASCRGKAEECGDD